MTQQKYTVKKDPPTFITITGVADSLYALGSDGKVYRQFWTKNEETDEPESYWVQVTGKVHVPGA